MLGKIGEAPSDVGGERRAGGERETPGQKVAAGRSNEEKNIEKKEVSNTALPFFSPSPSPSPPSPLIFPHLSFLISLILLSKSEEKRQGKERAPILHSSPSFHSWYSRG